MPKTVWVKLANEYVVSLFPIYMLVDAFYTGMQKRFGLGTPVAVKIQERAVEYYYQPQSWNAALEKLVGRIRQNPQYLRAIYEAMIQRSRRQAETTHALVKVSAKDTNKKLWQLYEKFIKTNLEVYCYGLLLPLLDYQSTTFLSDELRKILRSKSAKRYFLSLTTPLAETNVRRQDLALLKLFSIFRKIPKILKDLKKFPVGKLKGKLKKNHPRLYQLLENHTKDFKWVYYVYEGPAATFEYFLELLQDLARRGVNPDRELKKIQKEKTELRRVQEKTIEHLRLNPYEKQIVLLARDSLVYKAWRRELQSHAYYHAEFLLRQIGLRLNLTLAQVRMLLPHEVKAGLNAAKIDIKELNQRLKCVVYGAPKSTSCLSGKVAENFAKKYFPKEPVPKLSKTLLGTPAYMGKIKGTARVINSPNDMSKMNQGDILVSATTNPNLMPAIRRAAAIVTDEGGLTCHAAIVSRELKIPCVVGTNYATKLFRDGDRVEVDAGKGVVRKI